MKNIRCSLKLGVILNKKEMFLMWYLFILSLISVPLFIIVAILEDYLLLFGLFLPGVAFGLSIYHIITQTCRKKEIKKWLSDAVELDAKVSKVDSYVATGYYWIVPVKREEWKIKVEFSYDGLKKKKISGQNNVNRFNKKKYRLQYNL